MSEEFENRFIRAIRHQLAGLSNKVANEFSQENYEKELSSLQNDPVYGKFSFSIAEYVLIRFMGRISISVGRRLGEIFDKVPRFAAAARFNLTPAQIAPKLHGLELDIALLFSEISEIDKNHIITTYNKYFNKILENQGVGIEIRYNFNPNDSSRLRKDQDMMNHISAVDLKPIYLIFSTSSPRKDAISRLTNYGWSFLVGDEAIAFISELLQMEFQSILDQPAIKNEIKGIIDEIMKNLVNSHAFNQVLDKHKKII